jgi:hypothetical protein
MQEYTMRKKQPTIITLADVAKDINNLIAKGPNQREFDQNGLLNILEKSLSDLIVDLRLLSSELPADESVSGKIKASINQSLSEINEDNVLRLYEVSSNPSTLLSAIPIPDPVGILGRNNTKELYQSRYGANILAKTSSTLESILGKRSHTSIINTAATATTSAFTDPELVNLSRDILRAQATNDYKQVQMPIMTDENLTALVEEAFQNDERYKKFEGMYLDAASAMQHQFIKNPNSVPQVIVEKAKEEFIQNLRLLIINNLGQHLASSIDKVVDEIKAVEWGSTFRHVPPTLSTALMHRSEYSQPKEDREYSQDMALKRSVAQLSNIATSIFNIKEDCDNLLTTNSDPEVRRLALLMGADMNIRPTKRTGAPEYIYPTVLHEAAKSGDDCTIDIMIKRGVDVDPQVHPMRNWLTWYHEATYALKN